MIDRRQNEDMLLHTCTSCAKRQLIFPSQITGLVNTDHGIEVSFTCWCGADQTLLTGKAADLREHAASAA